MLAHGLLPAPAAATPSSSFSRPSRTRSRLIVVLITSVFAFLFTHHASRSYGHLYGMPWRPDLDDDFLSNEKPFHHAPVFLPDVTMDANDDVLKLPDTPPPPVIAHKPMPVKPQPLPILADPDDGPPIRNNPDPEFAHPFPSTDDPWPSKPHIALNYLHDHLESVPPPLPDWPEDEDVRTKPMDKKKQIAFKSLYLPRDYARKPLPGKATSPLPKVQFEGRNVESEARRKERGKRREWVKRAMIHGWEGYKRHAWGHDEVRPMAETPFDGFNGWGATLIDALDTLLLMGLTKEYDYARTHVKALDFTLLTGGASAYGSADGVTIPTFETAIRYLGGLLGAYDVSGDTLMLDRAQELGDWMLGAFGTDSGLPMGRYKLGENPKGDMGGRMVLSEAGSLTLEYTRLWQATGKAEYFHVVQRAMDFFDTAFESPSRLGRLLPGYVTPATPMSISGVYSFSAMCDSYYEYLIKQHLLLGGGTSQYARMYVESMESAYEHIIRDVTTVPGEDRLLTIGEQYYGSYRPTLDHLACFAGAMMGLGGKLLDRPRDMETAERFSYTCFWAYNSSASGIGPETLQFFKTTDTDRFETKTDTSTGTSYRSQRGHPPGVRPGGNTGYGGRPETIESVFYMWRLTGDPVWQDRAWQMFVAWVQHTITKAGFAGLHTVLASTPAQRDTQESFVFAETLKYYYLTFCDVDFLSLDDFVFNTEAHPLRLRPSERLAVPLTDWRAPDPAVQADYLEPHHAKAIGRGTVLQRQFRKANPGGGVRGLLNAAVVARPRVGGGGGMGG